MERGEFVVGIVIATHGSLAEGFKSAVELLVGPQEHVETLGLFHGDDPAAFEEKFAKAIDGVDTGDGVLCLVDLLGGTPSNVVLKLMKERPIRALAGVNLPAVIQTIFMRDQMGLEDLSREVFKAQREGVVDLNKKLTSMLSPEQMQNKQAKMEPGAAPAVNVSNTMQDYPSSSNKGKVVLCRIDDRLIHGQVMTSWVKSTGANKIMIVDDETAANPFLKTVYKGAVPSNVRVGVFNEKKAADRLIKGFKPTDRVIVLAKYPQTFLSLVNRGASISQIIIGGMGARGNRTKFYRNISATDEERQIFRELIAKGIDVEIQILADDLQVKITKLLK